VAVFLAADGNAYPYVVNAGLALLGNLLMFPRD